MHCYLATGFTLHTQFMALGDWIKAARPRTLPLAVSSVGLGGLLAYQADLLNLPILVWTFITTLLLQVLSNFANDYGDTVNGADSAAVDRKGPSRAVQSGAISASQMRNAVTITSGLAFLSGLYLLYQAFGTNWSLWLPFLGLGILAIIGAITYTMGKRPYGYAGLGDLAVFLFFGFLGVCGSFYLHAGFISHESVHGAIFIGAYSVLVLNLNNIRDIESDKKAGKMSIPVRIGLGPAMIYHAIILLGGTFALITYLVDFSDDLRKLVPVMLPLMNLAAATLGYFTRYRKTGEPKWIDKLLPMTAMSTVGAVFVLMVMTILSKYVIF